MNQEQARARLKELREESLRLEDMSAIIENEMDYLENLLELL